MRSEDLEPRRNEFLAMVVNEIRTPTVALSESLITLRDDWALRRRGEARRGEADILGDRGVEQVGVLAGQADHPAHVVLAQLPHVDAAHHVPPGVRFAEQHLGASVDFPAPLGPTSATRRPEARLR